LGAIHCIECIEGLLQCTGSVEAAAHYHHQLLHLRLQLELLTYTANMQTSLIGLEACSRAHFLGRALRKQGHDVRLIPAQFVKPFVKSNKNDFVDAEAIAEAVERKNMRFVPIKTDDQLDLQAIHRVRDRLISRRTAVINQLRAFLLERGMVFAQRQRSSRPPWRTSSRTRKRI
jgi:transposase